MHNKFTSFPDASITSPIPGGGVSLANGSAAGNRLPYAPNLTFDLSADYVVAVSNGNLDFNITNSYNDGYPAEPDNVLHQPAFDTLNSSITWNSSDQRSDVKVWATNILDKAVASLLYTAVPLGYNAIYGNLPRTYGFTATYKFGRE